MNTARYGIYKVQYGGLCDCKIILTAQ